MVHNLLFDVKDCDRNADSTLTDRRNSYNFIKLRRLGQCRI